MSWEPRFLLRALRYRNYRLFFGGQLVSLVGTWMTTTAVSWLVYRLTGSALLLGVVGFAGQFPAFLLAPVAGIFVDRWDQHRLLVATQTLSMLQSFALAALTLTGRVTVGWVVGLFAFQGLVNAFDMPCRQAFVVTMVEDRNDLSNAIALNSSMFNGARLVGPAVSGLLIAAAGEGWCFLVDGVSYLAVIAALLAMTIRARPRRADRRGGALAQLGEGWRYVSGFLPVRSIIILLAVVSLAGAPYGVLIPIVAGRTLGGGPHALGFLMAGAGAGALLGALWLASRRNVLGLVEAISAATVVFGTSLALFSWCRSLHLCLPLMVVIGASLMLQFASSNTILQTLVDDDKRGRVMSFFMMAFMGTAPFGSLLAGSLAARVGTPMTFRLMGLCCLGGALWFARRLPALRRAVHPVYRRMGILPPVARALETAAELGVPPEEA